MTLTKRYTVLLDLTYVSGKQNLSCNLTNYRTVKFPCGLLICSFPFTVVYTRVLLCSYMSLFDVSQTGNSNKKQAALQFVLNWSNLTLGAPRSEKFLHTHQLLL